jgi:hypothetical protein
VEIPDEVSDPVVIGLLGDMGVVQCPDPVAHLMQESGPWHGITFVYQYSVVEAEEYSGVKPGGRYMETNNRAHGDFT